MFMTTIERTDKIKERHINPHSLVLVKLSVVKSASNMFGISV